MVVFAGAALVLAATATPAVPNATLSVTAPAMSLRLCMYFLSAPGTLWRMVGNDTGVWEKSFQRGRRIGVPVMTGVQPSGRVRTTRARGPGGGRKPARGGGSRW